MKKLITISVAILLAISSVSCEKNDKEQITPENNEVASITYEPAATDEKEKETIKIEEIDESILAGGDGLEINYLDEMNGYWVRPDEYEKKENETFTSFLVESNAGIWTPYYDGTAGQALKCTGDIDGLHLEDIEGNIISYAYDGIALLESDGTVVFVRGDKIPE